MFLNSLRSLIPISRLAQLSVLSLAFAVPSFAESTSAQSLKPFESDGCSSFPDGTFHNQSLWYECCKAHDYAYWRGGTYDERLQADEDLRVCVAEQGQPEIAFIMLMGVRVGGVPWIPTEFRWGYGWSYPKGYGRLSEGELALIEALDGEEHLVKKRSKTRNTALNKKNNQTLPLVISGDQKVSSENK